MYKRVVSVISGHEFFLEKSRKTCVSLRVTAVSCRSVGGVNKHPLGKRVSNKHPLETCRVLFEQPLRVSFRVDFD